MPTQSGFRRHLRGRIAFQANLSLPPAIPGRCPGVRHVRMVKMQGAEDEGAGSVLKYMTKPESDSNTADWPL